MGLRQELEELKSIKEPSKGDYERLIKLAESILSLFHKERKARSSLNKKNQKLALRLGLNQER